MIQESDNAHEMAQIASNLESVTLTLEVELEPDRFIRYYELKDSPIPAEIMESAWKSKVREEIDKQYENKGEYIKQLVKQGVLGEAALEDVEGVSLPSDGQDGSGEGSDGSED
jgi:hypothetical protein